MKYPFTSRSLPWSSLGMGGLALALRTWLYLTGVDRKGLLIPSHPATTLVFLLAALFLGTLLLCVLPLKRSAPYPILFPRSAAAALGNVVGAAGILLSALSLLSHRENTVALAAGYLGFPAAACLLFCGWCRWKGLRPSFVFHGIVTVFLLLYCICQYRVWSIDPQFGAYFFPLLGCALLMIYAYQRTALDFGIGNLQMFTFTGQAALFFCLAAIPDGNRIFFLTMALWCAADTPSHPQPGGDSIASA